eukprot:204080-Rhodomonas_salina.3
MQKAASPRDGRLRTPRLGISRELSSTPRQRSLDPLVSELTREAFSLEQSMEDRLHSSGSDNFGGRTSSKSLRNQTLTPRLHPTLEQSPVVRIHPNSCTSRRSSSISCAS